MRHPEVRDVCDIGQLLFWNSKWAWWFTAVMFVLNNTFIQVCTVDKSCGKILRNERIWLYADDFLRVSIVSSEPNT